MSNEFNRQEMTLSRRFVAAIVCLFAVSVLAVAITTDNGAGLVRDATAASPSDEDVGSGYFPAQFPTVSAPIQPHIEAF